MQRGTIQRGPRDPHALGVSRGWGCASGCSEEGVSVLIQASVNSLFFPFWWEKIR